MNARASFGRAAVPPDMPAVSACLTSAFFEDPVWGTWAFPDRSTRAAMLSRLLSFWASAAISRPWVRMTEQAEAVAVWIPPGVAELTDPEEAAFEVLVDELFVSRAQELHDLFELFEQHHPKQEPHYYLSLWATHREHGGKGVGTFLIEDNLATIDAERMPAYLESTNPANIGRYEALGFRPRSEFGAVNGPTITTMWREAR